MRSDRILFVVNDASFFVSHRLALAIGVRAAGYDVHVAVPPAAATDLIRDAGFVTHSIPLHRSSTSPLGELRTVKALVDVYRRLNPRLVHHITAKPILYGGLAARIARIPAMVHAVTGLGYAFIDQHVRARAIRFLIRRAYRVATTHANCAVIFQNQDDRAMFDGVLRCTFTELIPGSGVDTRTFHPTPMPDTSTTPIVVLPARLLGDKGVNEFVEAARILRQRGVRARYALVGGLDPGNPNAILGSMLDTWVQEGLVEWWGHRDDMPAVLGQATIVCLPSYREGMPKALLEACVVGRPIVTTDVPGCRHVVSDAFGRLVPARSADALARALEELLNDPTRLRRMGAAASAHGQREFGVDRVISATLGVYERLLHNIQD